MNKDVKFIPSTGLKLTFDAITGFAENPQGDTAIAFSADFRDALITAVGTGTIKVYGSCQKNPPDFGAASTITNSWAAITLADYSLADTKYNGATGMTVAGSSMICELDINLLTWIAIHRSANTVYVLLTLTNAQ